jgi:hypothetical protein
MVVENIFGQRPFQMAFNCDDVIQQFTAAAA